MAITVRDGALRIELPVGEGGRRLPEDIGARLDGLVTEILGDALDHVSRGQEMAGVDSKSELKRRLLLILIEGARS